jgi:hypothetical protein
VRDCFRFFEKNFLRIFFNHAFGVTEPKEAPYVTTGNNLKLQALIILKLKLVLYLRRLQLFLDANGKNGWVIQIDSGQHVLFLRVAYRKFI